MAALKAKVQDFPIDAPERKHAEHIDHALSQFQPRQAISITVEGALLRACDRPFVEHSDFGSDRLVTIHKDFTPPEVWDWLVSLAIGGKEPRSKWFKIVKESGLYAQFLDRMDAPRTCPCCPQCGRFYYQVLPLPAPSSGHCDCGAVFLIQVAWDKMKLASQQALLMEGMIQENIRLKEQLDVFISDPDFQELKRTLLDLALAVLALQSESKPPATVKEAKLFGEKLAVTQKVLAKYSLWSEKESWALAGRAKNGH